MDGKQLIDLSTGNVDLVEIIAYHEALLCRKIGYSLLCELEGVTGQMVVDDCRVVAGDGNNLEVLTIYGWRKPHKCWGVGPCEPLVSEPQAEQRGLFG